MQNTEQSVIRSKRWARWIIGIAGCLLVATFGSMLTGHWDAASVLSLPTVVAVIAAGIADELTSGGST